MTKTYTVKKCVLAQVRH